MSRWVRRQLTHPWRAFFVLVVLAAPPNPLFDVAGLAAGATGVPFWLFFGAVLLARIARFAVLLTVGIRLLGG
jgi:membrane protein YqaA with SNARE-associated domain